MNSRWFPAIATVMKASSQVWVTRVTEGYRIQPVWGAGLVIPRAVFEELFDHMLNPEDGTRRMKLTLENLDLPPERSA